MTGEILYRDYDLLRKANAWMVSGVDFASALVLKTWGSAPCDVGSFMMIDHDGEFYGSVSGGCVENAVVVAAKESIKRGIETVIEFGVSDQDILAIGLACGGRIQILIEPSTGTRSHWAIAAFELIRQGQTATLLRKLNLSRSAKPIESLDWLTFDDADFGKKTGFDSIKKRFIQSFQVQKKVLIIGGVHIAQALIGGLKALDFEVTIIDPRTVWANVARFPNTQILNSWPEDALADIRIDRNTAIVALTHDPKFDDAAIAIGLRSSAFYVGALGGSKSAIARRERLRGRGLSDLEIDELHSPIGLSIGAKGPLEISISILADLIQSYRGES